MRIIKTAPGQSIIYCYFQLPPHHNKSYDNKPLHRTFLREKPSKTYNCDKINQPKVSNSATDGDIFLSIKGKIESLFACLYLHIKLNAFVGDLIEGQETNLRKTTSFVDLQFSLKQE